MKNEGDFKRGYSVLVGDVPIARSFARASWDAESECYVVSSKTELFGLKELALQADRRSSRFALDVNSGLKFLELHSERSGSRRFTFDSLSEPEIPRRVDWILENNAVALVELAMVLMDRLDQKCWKALNIEDGSVHDLTIDKSTSVITTPLGFALTADGRFDLIDQGGVVSLIEIAEPFPDWEITVAVPQDDNDVPREGVVEQQVALTCSAGNVRGTFTTPADRVPTCFAVIIGGSGFHDRDGRAPGLSIGYDNWAKELALLGMANLRFDRYENEVMLQSIGIDDAVDQVLASIDFLSEQAHGLPVGIVGHSLGALIAAMASSKRSQVSYVILLSASDNSLREIVYQQVNRFASSVSIHRDHGPKILSQTRETLSPDDPASGLTRLSRDVLDFRLTDFLSDSVETYIVIHGDADIQVDPESAVRLHETLLREGRAVDLVMLEGRDHIFHLDAAPHSFSDADGSANREASTVLGRAIMASVERTVLSANPGVGAVYAE